MAIWPEQLLRRYDQELKRGKVPCDTYKMSKLYMNYVAKSIKYYLCHCPQDKRLFCYASNFIS